MTEHGTYPAQRGHAWRGDWKERLRALLEAHGHESATSLLRAHPRKHLVSLAEELGPGDVAAVQLEWVAIDEAKGTGPQAVEWLARDLLVRYLHEHMPAGWNDADAPPIYNAFGSWAGALEARDVQVKLGGEEADLTIVDAFYEHAPRGWLPADADDPILVAAFRDHWPRQHASGTPPLHGD